MLVLSAMPVLALGLAAIHQSLGEQSISSVYTGFLGALTLWGWIELSFLAGVITGPVKSMCPDGLSPVDRFSRAFGTVAFHELALTIGLFGLVIVSQGAANRMALATYLVLYLARILAKLNLFMGVPRINIEFLPDRLAHLRTYFRLAPPTLMFAIAITVLTALLAICAQRLWTAGSDFTATGYALLTALAALALLEHWLMVVPLPDAKLWRWMLPAPETTPKKEG